MFALAFFLVGDNDLKKLSHLIRLTDVFGQAAFYLSVDGFGKLLMIVT